MDYPSFQLDMPEFLRPLRTGRAGSLSTRATARARPTVSSRWLVTPICGGVWGLSVGRLPWIVLHGSANARHCANYWGLAISAELPLVHADASPRDPSPRCNQLTVCRIHL